jgi:hypothetical protein
MITPSSLLRSISTAARIFRDEGPRGVRVTIERKLLDRFFTSNSESRQERIKFVKQATAMTVYSGPFAGTRFEDRQTWGGGGDIGPQLLGVYEQELRPAIQRFVERQPTAIINIGCAEGYYAVGLARLLPSAKVFAFDIDARAQEVCYANAILNNVEERFEITGHCSPARLSEIANNYQDCLIIADCEGYEKKLLIEMEDKQSISAACLIIEVHTYFDETILPSLVGWLSSTHRISQITSGGRNPNDFAFLDGWPEVDKWLLICENRPTLQTWLICEPRA